MKRTHNGIETYAFKINAFPNSIIALPQTITALYSVIPWITIKKNHISNTRNSNKSHFHKGNENKTNLLEDMYTNLFPSHVGHKQGLMATGSYKGDHSMVAFPLHSLHM
ncbi:LOW QUALITY PROTEIN: hypothetical protein PanWU01x14_020790 [Parasponia andersonii]|uniref:Uncharacterized protein n=1 Tax=Parasponia andersonii TaxID=3476 RepID=A0A2P5DYR2_PARAD|nr:LOW QUALITY PROTEIN: hypothetical protein PanWU01x14_020790 [Parasponia andersonii]